MRAGAILVDTHILLWVRLLPERLRAAEQITLASASVRFVSIVTLWEIAVLQSLGRVGPDKALLEVPQGFTLLRLEPQHCSQLSNLPFVHRDPFDRMLIAQAVEEQVPFVTRDSKVRQYDVAGLFFA